MNSLMPGELDKMLLFWSWRATSHIMCAMCDEDMQSPNRCSGCLRVSYCSTTCQAEHWKQNHKWICKTFRALNKYDKEELNPIHQETRTFYVFCQDILRQNFFQKTYTREDWGLYYNLVVSQPYCSKCYRTEFQLDKSTNVLRACPDCKVAFECTTCTANLSKPSQHTRQRCIFAKEVILMGAFQAKWLRSEMVPPIVAASQEVRTRYTPLSTVKNWQEYFTTLSEYNSSSLFVDSSFKILPPHSSDPTALEAWRGFKLTSGKLWRPLTVINALEKLYPDIATRESLTIHWLNAMRPDVTTVVTLAGILHHFPALKRLQVTLFYDVLEGRQLIGYCGPHETTKEYNFNGKTLTRTVIGHNFDHFDKFFSAPDYKQPDLHVSFHSIFLGREDWKWMPPIKFVVKEKFKIVFTVHSASKWQEEVAIIKKMGGKLIDEGGPNVWKNIVPRVDLLTVEDPYSLIEPHSWYYITGEK